MKKIILYSIFTLLLYSCNSNSKIENISLIPVKMGENFEYVNTKGEIVINPQFSDASIFRNGIALVKTSGENAKWGFIDTDGKYLINPTYKSATIFSEDIAWVVSENGAPNAINKNGEIKFTLKEAENVRIFKNGLAAFSKSDSVNNKWGFVNNDGKIKINPQFKEVLNFTENKCAVKNKDDKWGFIDTDGKITINCQFDDARSFENNTAVVYLKDKAGVIDIKGKYIINPQFSSLSKDGNMYLFMQEDKYGWCDGKGKIIINPQFETAQKFNGNDLASVKIDKQYGYIDKKGKIVINPQFNYAASFNNNIALVQSSDKTGFIDKEGKYLINPQFDGFSYDYLTYVITGETVYESIQTDYFDINKIVDEINYETLEGLTFTNNFSQIVQKFKINSASLNTYDSNLKIISDKKITTDATYSFEALGTPFDYNSNYNKVFMGNNLPYGYIYEIKLSGKAYGKAKNICTMLKAKLKGYELVKEGFIDNNEVSIYKNKEKQIVINNTNNLVFFIIVKGDYDISGYISTVKNNNDSVSYDNQEYDSEAVDSTAAAATETVDSIAAPAYDGY
ncbi:WG repeat-containing protein [Flavobacterium sp.]|uniref:WG repeat-containing protein n=1 Tax=Flavobacterium sp. TaxID=239 RepID=UPI00375240DE